MIFGVSGDGRMTLGAETTRCALGWGGLRPASLKREGDGCTPIGRWPIRQVLWRPDRLPPPPPRLDPAPITPRSSWCDDPLHPDYNRPVTLPHPARTERLWRDDHLYDIIVVLGHNDDPVIPGAGSAIFLHIARSDFAPTEGCVAVAIPAMRRLLEMAVVGDLINVAEDPPAP
jgi:L,D-peptidoglycan transpeptidase YkuD (ErfK/YbiS/YcfS/YnhG family)